ncbi:MAG: hypothetical protein IPH82_26750 [Chloroflexi bacterium]|nr:hypothetical protein [Chloroflexota bacterium]
MGGESAAVTAVLDLMHRIDSLAYGYNIQSYDANIVAADKEGQGRYGWFLHQSMGEK